VSYALPLSPAHVRLSIDVLNLFDTRTVENVYPTTGSPDSDGWLQTEYGTRLSEYAQFKEFYTAINLKNRWAYMTTTGYDIYGPPRQILFGLSVGM
jgi:hypothetical protein